MTKKDWLFHPARLATILNVLPRTPTDLVNRQEANERGRSGVVEDVCGERLSGILSGLCVQLGNVL